MKIPFDIKFRSQIESGEYKVETFSGYPVTIYRWDFDDGTQTPIMGSYVFEDGKEYVGAWNEEGHFDLMSPNDLDLFVITPEPRFSEFEKIVNDLCWKVGMGEVVYEDDIIKKMAAELLSFAREQFIKDGYVIEKKAFHDAVENISDKHQVEMSVEYALYENETRRAVMNWEEFQKVAQHFIDCGKAEALKEIEQDPESSYAFKRGVEYRKEEALKDLPRWKKCDPNTIYNTKCNLIVNGIGRYIILDGYMINVDHLEKLPKED